MARKKYAKIDLTEIKGLRYALQFASKSIQSEIDMQLREWAESTKKQYDMATNYGNGFKSNPKYSSLKSFYTVIKSNKFNGFYVAVGQECFIAKFLEVGTKPHIIKQKQRGIEFAVSGILGNRSLSNVWNKNQSNISERIEKIVQKTISRGL